MNIEQNNQRDALISFWGGGGGGGGGEKGEKRSEGEQQQQQQNIVCVPASVLSSRPPCFLIQFSHALI